MVRNLKCFKIFYWSEINPSSQTIPKLSKHYYILNPLYKKYNYLNSGVVIFKNKQKVLDISMKHFIRLSIKVDTITVLLKLPVW